MWGEGTLDLEMVFTKVMDDGKTWKNMGLKKSEHLSKIIVHPENPNIIG